MNSKLISGVTEFLNTDSELNEVNIMQAQSFQLFCVLGLVGFHKFNKVMHSSYRVHYHIMPTTAASILFGKHTFHECHVKQRCPL